MTKKRRIIVYILLSIAGVIALTVGVALGIGVAAIRNTPRIDALSDGRAALPSSVYDVDGRLITQFFSDENRELISIDDLPRHLIYATITREDQTFFEHPGFSVRGTARAAWNYLIGSYFSGGSTITQQLAGNIYADRTDISITRKLRELWWALQLERSLTKYEILELYLNSYHFGHGNYGVEKASQFYFGHSATDLTIAESAMLVIQLANPTLYSPIRRPNEARIIQRQILDQMVELGYATQEEVDVSFDEYWNNYTYTRSNTSTAFFDREDKAPYFSEYVRLLLETEYLLGSSNINKDGYAIYTTLDLDHQAVAEEEMRSGLAQANALYQANTERRVSYAEEQFAPVIDLLSLTLDLPQLHVANAKLRHQAVDVYQEKFNPLLDVVSLMLGSSDQDELRHATRMAYAKAEDQAKRTTVEGALITLENDTGYILAMVGGSRFEQRNQFNRAIDARVEPGSSFKPLYYSAAIENQVITPATMLYDAPVVFWNDDGTPYTPLNYKGEWEGPVLARYALAHSMNVPSLRILDRLGFTAALDTAASLLGIPEREMVSRNLVRRFPVGLGIVEVAPIEMAQAFATFPNQGRRVTPLAVRYIKDREGRIIAEPERQLREQQLKSAEESQLISPETAYIMTDLLQSTVESGTLRYAASTVGGFDHPTGGKTGTTQNWSDAWTVGFTRHVTTAIWFGFDRGGSNSLGTNQTGATTTGPVWARYMKAIHEDLPVRDFVEPNEGLVRVEVSARTGLLPTENYDGEVIEELFIAGTQPKEFDQRFVFEEDQEDRLVSRLREDLETRDLGIVGLESRTTETSTDLDFRLDFDLPEQEERTLDFGVSEEEETNPLLD